MKKIITFFTRTSFSKSNFSLLAIVFALLMIAGCDGCINRIDIATVEGPDPEPCGGYDWKVTFTLQEASAGGGIIVQKIHYTADITRCDGTVEEDSDETYWEAWIVDAGSRIEQERAAGRFAYDDNYMHVDNPGTEGSIEMDGLVRFFEGQALPAGFVAGGVPMAGGLPATRVEPAFWTETDAQEHDLTSVWNCCEEGAPREFNTIPETGAAGGGRQTSPLDQTMNPIGQMIYSIPAWTEGYDDTLKLQQVLAVANELSGAPQNDFSAGVGQFYKAYADKPDNIAQLSKVYVLLRVMYDLPAAIDISEMRFFGGWILPEMQSGPIDAGWPVSVAADSSITIPGKMLGYMGRPYNAPGELDFFNEKFQRRTVIR